ncbi:MAG: alpha/beta hydrolase [Pseudomonadota bacterium]
MWTLDQPIETSAGRVAAAVFGSGQPLVLAHGWPWSSYAWHRVAPALARRYRVHVYDMPGFGASQKQGPRHNDLATQSDVFAEMLTHWQLDAPAVIAHDFGGAITLRAQLLAGVALGPWVLMNVVAMRLWGSDFFDYIGQHAPVFGGLPPHIHAAIVGAYVDSALARPIAAQDRTALIAPWLDAEGQAAFYAQFALADEALTAAFEPHLPSAHARVLWGTERPWIPLARGTVLAEAIGTDLHPLDGLGHLPQLEAPDQVAGALLTALEAA